MKGRERVSVPCRIPQVRKNKRSMFSNQRADDQIQTERVTDTERVLQRARAVTLNVVYAMQGSLLLLQNECFGLTTTTVASGPTRIVSLAITLLHVSFRVRSVVSFTEFFMFIVYSAAFHH